MNYQATATTNVQAKDVLFFIVSIVEICQPRGFSFGF